MPLPGQPIINVILMFSFKSNIFSKAKWSVVKNLYIQSAVSLQWDMPVNLDFVSYGH